MSIDYDPELTTPVSIALACTGYVVACADALGMGINYDTNPYCQYAQSWAVVDMIRAARDLSVDAPNITWDERIFMTGYSEGGYNTMVAARDIQLNHAEEFTVTAAAPLGGPYALSTSMKDVMLNSGADYPAPYFLPYFLAGYEAPMVLKTPSTRIKSQTNSISPGMC